MKFGYKLLFGGLASTGTVGVTTLALNSSFGSMKPISEINLPRGGRSIGRSPSLSGDARLEFKTITPNDKTISLENNVAQFPQVKLSLDSHSYKDLDVSTFKNESSSGDSIQRVKRAIATSSQLENIEGEVSEKYLSILQTFLKKGEEKDIKTHISNFQDVQRRVRSQKLIKEDDDGITYSLEQDKRKSLKKIYKLHRRLMEEQNKFSQNLSSIVEIRNKAPKASIPEDLSTFLNQIGWSGKQIKLTNKEVIEGQTYSNDWGDWIRNPFRKFYDRQEDFQEDLEKINQLIKSLEKKKQEVEKGHDIWVSPKMAKKSLEYRRWWIKKKLENAKFLVEFKVAKKLLERIRQQEV